MRAIRAAPPDEQGTMLRALKGAVGGTAEKKDLVFFNVNSLKRYLV